MIECYWTTPKDVCNFLNHYKKTNKRGSILKVKNIQNGKVKIAVKTNKDAEWTLVKVASASGFDFNNWDFANLSFEVGDSSNIVFKTKKKKFIDIQLKIYLDDEIDEEGKHINLDKPFGIVAIEHEDFLGGYAKR